MTNEPLPRAIAAELQSILDGPTEDRAHRLQDLCARHPRHRDVLAAAMPPARTSLAPEPTTPEAMPEAVGRYRILGLLGEGGMGAVYAAEQSEPVRRRVAVKVVKPGLDSKRVLARFEAERQALAMMSHPHITRVLDAGTTPDGRPYFVMEQVRGERLTEFCDKHRLALPARIALFQQVCSGVAHAHQRGIIHRDLKPSNILVELVEDKPVAKIIDFGVARALDQRLSEHTVYTEVGQMVGTLEYMSPEQAEMTIAEIDTRTDVYSLGAILYELLAGQLPFNRKELLEAGYAGMSRKLREVVPPKPSTRVTSAAHDTDALARLRDARGQDYVRLLRGDLDWITMKALEKDRIRRYQSPLDLSADLQRFLDHEPVLAGPPSAWYRTSKFVRRHRVPVAAAAAVLMAVVGGGSWSTVMWFKASEAEARATRERDAKELVLRDYRRVKDRVVAHSLVLEPDTLWPPTPKLVPKLDDWLERAGAIAGVAGEAQSSLTEILSRGREVHGVRYFADIDDEVRHLVLTDLLSDVSRLANLRPWMEQRLAWAKHEEWDTITGHEAKARWTEAIADIAKDPRFQGHPLRPQLGLLPLGKNRQGLWEFAFPRSGRWVPPPYTQSRLTRETIQPECCIVFVLIPGGEFQMGAGPEDNDVEKKETLDLYQRPTRTETVEPFFLAKFELSQHQWMQLAQAESNPSTYTARSRVSPIPDLSFPVDSISWNECARVLQHHELELPGEVQWEYACRAGTKTTWSCPGEDLKAHANLADQAAAGGANSANEYEPWDDGCAFAAPPLQLRPNGFGLHHMHGNVAEWCRDLWHVPGKNPEPTEVQRILRSGAHNKSSRLATSAWRSAASPGLSAPHIGVRPARALQP